MKLSIIIPVYNEEKTVKTIIERVKAVRLPIKKEILVVDDGSTDNTFNVVKRIKAVRLIHYEKNKGKGAAIRLGMKKSTGDIIIVQDADLEYNPDEYPLLLDIIIRNKARVVYGSRFKQKINPRYWSFYFGNKLITSFVNILYGIHLTDLETCYKCFKRDVLKGMKLKEGGFGFEPEFTANVLNKGHKIIEVPISYKPRSIKMGKKIKWTDGVEALWILLKKRFLN